MGPLCICSPGGSGVKGLLGSVPKLDTQIQASQFPAHIFPPSFIALPSLWSSSSPSWGDSVSTSPSAQSQSSIDTGLWGCRCGDSLPLIKGSCVQLRVSHSLGVFRFRGLCLQLYPLGYVFTHCLLGREGGEAEGLRDTCTV